VALVAADSRRLGKGVAESNGRVPLRRKPLFR